MIYVLICLSLSLAGVAGLQFFYMMYLEQLGKEQKKRIRELERHSKNMTNRLREAEAQITEQNQNIYSVYDEMEEGEEVWADVLEEN